ncbi:hypothetical protein PFICI_03396 [Pestalotiopsis fici W106-1]|uniref:Uncharacterized protein n=1 Tax=Pestalotiopsis fici (strain W106-1 / CGMCC3.15140) TaxID=1229662 RepID=W3XJH6_PESFW|nr:uncharacterized protein PFICI_03396 [Pestalotiopsis fici W106-1]ETS85371.1 hypothetical protein PFICI_03396 [Pestalotiopsis fici W106-1]
MLVDILSHHATTLRVLRIRQMGTEAFDEFNINHFTALDTLEICSSSLLPTAHVACESWALANLKRLVMNCSASSSRHGPQSYFIERIQEWLKLFASAVFHRKKSCQVALQEIEILWYTDSFHHSLPLPDERRRMEDVRLHIEECGLQAILTFQDRYPPIEDDEGYEDEF